MYWLYFVRKLSYYFKKRLGLTLKTSDEGGGGGVGERQRLNELKLFVERIVEKNGEKLWSFGYGTRQKKKFWLFFGFVKCIWEYWEERGKNDYWECHLGLLSYHKLNIQLSLR